MKTFLVPTDFSPAGRNATEYAAELARQFSATLILFHAYLVPTPVSEVPYVMVTVEDLQHENEEELAKEALNIQQKYGVQTEQIVRIGVASDEIRELSREKNVDLVVMGMKGAGGLDKIIGSTTVNAIRKSKAPVLIIPHNARFMSIHDIAYASDFSYERSVELFHPLLELANQFNARLHIVHVEKKKEKVTVEEASGEFAMGNTFEHIDHEFVTITSDSVNQGINEYIHDTPCQLLVMVAHKHSFFERIFSRRHTTAMAYETHIPLLVLQDR